MERQLALEIQLSVILIRIHRYNYGKTISIRNTIEIQTGTKLFEFND